MCLLKLKSPMYELQKYVRCYKNVTLLFEEKHLCPRKKNPCAFPIVICSGLTFCCVEIIYRNLLRGPILEHPKPLAEVWKVK